MIPTRWRKLPRDLRRHAGRSAFVVLALAIALGAAGTLLIADRLGRATAQRAFAASLPVAATITFDGPVSPRLVARVRDHPDIAAARALREYRTTIDGEAGPLAARIVALDAFARDDIGRLAGEAGAWPPRDGIAIERSSVAFAGTDVGETLTLRDGRGARHAIAVDGIVRDVSQAPGWMEHVVVGFAQPRTLEKLGASAGFDRLQFRLNAAHADRATIRAAARAIAALAAADNLEVIALDVPPPGEHVHQAQMDAMWLTQAAFALLTLVAAGLLVADLVAALLATHAREIAVMKAIGADARTIATMYLVHVAMLAVAACVLAAPFAWSFGTRYAAMRSEMLNFPPSAAADAWPWLGVVAMIAVLLAWTAAALPLRRALRAPVAETLRDLGIVATGAPGRLPATARLVGATRLAAANVARDRGRKLVSIATLAIGGAVFLGAAMLREGVVGAVDRSYAMLRYDVELTWPDGIGDDDAPRALAAVRSVDGVDGADLARGARADAGLTPLDDGARFGIVGVAPATDLLAPSPTHGRWLANDDSDAIVVSERLRRGDARFSLGGTVTLRVDGEPCTWRVVGVIDAGPRAVAYATRDALAAAAPASTWRVLVRADSRDAARQRDLVAALRDALTTAGLPAPRSQRVDADRASIVDHLKMVVDFLGVMGGVMLVVGAFALASTLGVAVAARRREIGVLRAIGASRAAIIVTTAVEGMLVATIAALVALPLAVPIGRLLGDAFGRIMFTLATPAWPAQVAIATWFAVALLIGALASVAPAWRAARLQVARSVADG